MFIVAFAILTVYSVDFFAVVHTAVVNSIGARTYLFETLQHRSDISLLRQDDPASRTNNYASVADKFMRFHGEIDEHEEFTDDKVRPSSRRLTRVEEVVEGQIKSDATLDNSNSKASNIYIKTGYGICVNSACGAGG